MCLGTFSRRARSLATNYIFARVRIIGTLAPFCVIGDYKEFPITQKRYRKTSHPSAPHLLISDRSVHGFCGFAVSTICLKPSKIYLFLNNGFSAAMQPPHSECISSQRFRFYKSCIHQTQLPIAASPHRRISKRIYQRINLLSRLAERAVTVI